MPNICRILWRKCKHLGNASLHLLWFSPSAESSFLKPLSQPLQSLMKKFTVGSTAASGEGEQRK